MSLAGSVSLSAAKSSRWSPNDLQVSLKDAANAEQKGVFAPTAGTQRAVTVARIGLEKGNLICGALHLIRGVAIDGMLVARLINPQKQIVRYCFALVYGVDFHRASPSHAGEISTFYGDQSSLPRVKVLTGITRNNRRAR